MNAFELSTRERAAEGVRIFSLSNAPACDGTTDVPLGHVLGVHVGRAAHVWQQREDERVEGTFRHGQLTAIAAGCRTSCWTRVETSFVHVHLGQALVAHALHGARREWVPRFRFDDPVCRELVLAMAERARDRGAAARLYLESAAVVLAQHLIEPRAGAVRSGLSSAALRRAIELMHESLAEPPGVAELAEAAGVSSAHFSRLFKLSSGEAPHRYLNRLRLARAKELLHGSELRIVEIALAVGFANPSHFAAFFRSATGMSPTDYRRRAT